MAIVADAYQVDIGLAVDLSARQEEYVDAALAGAVEQLASAIGEERVPRAAEERNIGAPMSEDARRERGGGGNRRGIADRDVADVADEADDDVCQQLLAADVLIRRRAGHERAAPGSAQTPPPSPPGARTRPDGRYPPRSGLGAPAATRHAAPPRPPPRRSRRACRRQAADRRAGCRRKASPL